MEDIDNINGLLNTKVLKDTELNELFIKYQNGDNNARKDIILSNTRLILKFLKYGNSKEDKEDLFSVGLIGLTRATDTFNTNCGIKFSTYATACIKNEILLYLKKETLNWKVGSLNDLIQYEENETTEIIEMIPGEDITEDKACDNVIREDINKAVNNLSDLDKYIIKSIYGLGLTKKTTEEISENVPYTRQGVCFKRDQILNKLRREYTQVNTNTHERELTTLKLVRKKDSRIK